MKLYEINSQIDELMSQLDFDPETGEVGENSDVIFEQLASLQMERQSILEYLAKLVLNLRAEQSALKDEEKRLKERRTRLENKENRLLAILDRECNGETTNCGVATMYYRKAEHMEISDKDAALVWLQNNHEDFIRYAEPEINKTDVKKLIKSGTEIPGIAVISDTSHSLR